MAHYRAEGVVLRTIRLGEADRIITLVTPQHGKVRAVAKGVRKTKSRIGARLEPVTHVQMLLWRGRDLDIVTQVEVVDPYRAIRSDYERIAVAMSMLEVVDHVALERHASPELFQMLVRALSTLESQPSCHLLGAFFWKLLALEGVGADPSSCAHCGDQVPLVAFDAGEGGFLCHRCRKGQAVSQDVIEMVTRATGGGLAGLLREPETPATATFERLGATALEYHLDRRLRAVPHGGDTSRRNTEGQGLVSPHV